MRVGPNQSRIDRVGPRPDAVASRNRGPIAVQHPDPVVRVRRRAPGAIVLQTRAHRIRRTQIVADVIHLSERNVRGCRPGFAGVLREDEPAVVCLDDARAVGRPPHIVIVGMEAAGEMFERLAGIFALGEIHRERDDVTALARIDAQMREIKRPLTRQRVFVDELPVVARIIRAPQHAFGRLHERIHALGLARRDGNTDAPGDAGRQSRAQLRPRAPVVGRAIETAVGAAAGERPRLAAIVPHARVERIGMLGIPGEIRCTTRRTDVERFRPGLAAVGGAVHAARLAIFPRIAERRNDRDIRIARIDQNLGDRCRIGEAEMFERLRTVGRAPHPVAVGHVVARIAFPGADPHVVIVAR